MDASAPPSVPVVAVPPMSSGTLPRVTPQLFAPPLSVRDGSAAGGQEAELPLAELNEWRKRFDGLYGRLDATLAQTTVSAQAQDEESAQYKLATQTRIDQLTLLREALQADVTRLSATERALQQLVQQRDERIRDLEQESYASRMKAAQSASDAKQALARASSAEIARRVSEVRQQELQISSQYALAEVEKLRARLLDADEATRDSLLGQLTTFETLRQGVVDAFTDRETALLGQMNATVAAVHGGLRQELSTYCGSLQNEQTRALALLNEQFQAFCAQRDRQYGDQLAHAQRRCEDLETERQQLKGRCDADMRSHTEQCKRREDQLMRVIAEREQALLQREAKLRSDQEAHQREMSAQWAAKEAELAAKHAAALDAAREDARRDLSQLQTAFLDQVQKLSDAHLATEQEWQERYRERERTLAQSARRSVPGGAPGEAAESLQRLTDTSFLSKFDAIEARQRERAEQVRSTLLHRHSDPAPESGYSPSPLPPTAPASQPPS